MRLFLVFAALTMSLPASATTYYVRHNGGTLYDATNNPSGTCNGKGSGAPVGTTPNQTCAVGELQYLWDNGVYRTTSRGSTDWVIAAGDIVDIGGCANADGVTSNTFCHIGWRNNSNDYDGPTARRWGVAGGSQISGIPPPPSGTSGAHTVIRGSNYAACSANGRADHTKMATIIGGFGVQDIFDLTKAQYVDVECIEVTDHSACMRNSATGSNCHNSVPWDDYAEIGVGVNFDGTNGTGNVLLQDMFIHGLKEGVQGPLGSGITTGERVDIWRNYYTGWDFDVPPHQNTSASATFRFYDSSINYTGCNEEYPIVDAVPITSCFDQSHGAGNGDGIASLENDVFSIDIQRSIFRRNVQEGVDLLHNDGNHMTNQTVNVSDSVMEGNMGQALKIGQAFQSVRIANNLIMSNGYRMGSPIAGAPSGFNANLTDFCRAGPGNVRTVGNEETVTDYGNTYINSCSVGMVIGCSNTQIVQSPTAATGTCPNSVVSFKDDIIIGYRDNTDDANAGKTFFYLGTGAPYYSGNPVGTFTRDHNIYDRPSWQYPTYANTNFGIGTTETATNEIAASAASVLNAQPTGYDSTWSPSELDGIDISLGSASPAKWVGIALSGNTADFTGASYHAPPSMGAMEYGSAATSDSYPGGTYTPPPAPVITLQPSNQTVTAGVTATFTSAASGTPTPTVQWYRVPPGGGSGVAVSGATSASYTTGTLATSDSGATFYAVWTNSGGSATTSTATLTVNAATATLTSITVAPGSSTVGLSGSVTLATTGHYSNGTTGTVAASYTSSNTAVATVGASSGVVSAAGTGSATITASFGGFTATASVTITATMTIGSTIQNAATISNGAVIR